MSSLYPSSSSNPYIAPTVTEEEFKSFHSIDRTLYSKLVLNLDRDLGQSMQVMAFWIWLERANHVNDLVYKMLKWPETLINSMADEAVICLNCIERGPFHRFSLEHASSNDTIPMHQYVTKTGITLMFFFETRLDIIHAVSKIVDSVCLRAFDDIYKYAERIRRISATVVHGGNNNNNNNNINNQEIVKPFGPFNGPAPIINPAVLPILYGFPMGSPQIVTGGSGGVGGGYSGNFMHGFNPYDHFSVQTQRQILTNETGDPLSHIQISSSEQQRDGIKIVPADDRTIFLTFSKGYPISEEEVKDFFTRKYGNCIEAIHMQEVLIEEHQPLYARLIVHSPTLIQAVLEGRSKAKFTINGKHVWARKYIKKNPRFSPPLPHTTFTEEA